MRASRAPVRSVKVMGKWTKAGCLGCLGTVSCDTGGMLGEVYWVILRAQAGIRGEELE